MRLSLESFRAGRMFVVRCAGRIVSGEEAQALHDELHKLAEEHNSFVLDFSMLEYVDSAGLGMLVRLQAFARSRGGDLKLAAVPEFVRKTLQMTRLSQVLPSFETCSDALAAGRMGSAQGQNSGPRVVCVDPSVDVLAFLRTLLKGNGYDVSTASNIPDAKTLLKACRTDAIICGSDFGATAQTILQTCAPKAILLPLAPGFNTLESSGAAEALLNEIREVMKTRDKAKSA